MQDNYGTIYLIITYLIYSVGFMYRLYGLSKSLLPPIVSLNLHGTLTLPD